MKLSTFFIGATFSLALFVVSTLPVRADVSNEGAIVAIDTISSPRLNLYARDALDSKLSDMAKESVPLPLNVSEVTEDERFLKVKLGGETIWLNKKQVTVLRSVSAGCLAHVTAPTEAATTRGANNGCGK